MSGVEAFVFVSTLVMLLSDTGHAFLTAFALMTLCLCPCAMGKKHQILNAAAHRAAPSENWWFPGPLISFTELLIWG